MPLSKPSLNAPWWWKRLESALIYMLTGLIPLVGLSETLSEVATHDITLIWLPGGILAVKSIGIFFMGTPADTDDLDKNIFNMPKPDITGENNTHKP